ncbi:MAG: nicotinate (nicotinamide) nucleotide adenylyltransferase [Epsilonproteobacteria bacterium]|nr:nicotinate (nicotinamide) nucleotide adenylyltransferase [Campylobacterota bacterium]
MKTIALFGGSFDPPHIAHVAIVDALLKLNKIDKVVVMPAYLNPFKSEFHAPSELRLKWLREIFTAYNNVEVSDYEISQARSVRTIESVEHLLQTYSSIYLVIGADNLEKLPLWQNYERLSKLVRFIVATREGIKIPDGFIKLEIGIDVSSTRLRDEIDTTMLPFRCAQEIERFYKEKKCKQELKKS